MKRIFTLLVLVATTMIAMAATPTNADPIRWRINVAPVQGTPNTYTLTIKALVAEGSHIYGLDVPKGGPQPTSFNFDGTDAHILFTDKGVVPSPAPEVAFDPLFEIKLPSWSRNVTFTRTFTVAPDAPEGAAIKCAVKYMSCDNTTCSRPRTKTLTIKVK